jgi:hypothetical protein
MSLMSFAANAVSPILVPNTLKQTLDYAWSRENFTTMFKNNSKTLWTDGFSKNPIFSSEQLPPQILQLFEKFLGRTHQKFDIDLEYSVGGFFVNREYFLRKDILYLLCCGKKISTQTLNVNTLSRYIHGPDFEVLTFVVFLATLPFGKLFELFFHFGTTTAEQDVSYFQPISFAAFLEIFSDVQLELEGVFVKPKFV